MSMRCDPLIHGLMDSEQQLEALLKAISVAGCKEIAVSYLFLRSAITKGLKQNIANTDVLNEILKPYSDGAKLPIGMKSSMGTMLPIKIRKAGFERIRRIANKLGINVHICGCKNSDITKENCYITRVPASNTLFEY